MIVKNAQQIQGEEWTHREQQVRKYKEESNGV